MLCLVMRYREKVIVIMTRVVFLLIGYLSICVYEAVEFQTGRSDFIHKDPRSFHLFYPGDNVANRDRHKG